MPDKQFVTLRRGEWTVLPDGARLTLIRSNASGSRVLWVSPDGVETVIDVKGLTAADETGKMTVPVIAGAP